MLKKDKKLLLQSYIGELFKQCGRLNLVSKSLLLLGMVC